MSDIVNAKPEAVLGQPEIPAARRDTREDSMRALMLLLLAACQDGSDRVGSIQSGVTVVTWMECNTNDLRLFAEPSFTGAHLCLRGPGTYSRIHNELPNGFGSFRVGQYTATFSNPGAPVSFEPYTDYPKVGTLGENGTVELTAIGPLDMSQ